MTEARSRDDYAAFASKRVARIWLPFAVAIVSSAVLMKLTGTTAVAGASPWFAYTWSEPLSLNLIRRTLMMTGRTITLDNPMWSLVHEMRISMIIPVLLVLTRRSWWTAALLACVGCAVAAEVLRTKPAWVAPASLTQTFLYIPAFVLGIGIALHSHLLRHWIADLPRPLVTLLWLVALGGMAWGPPASGLGIATSPREVLHLLLVTGTAGLLLVLCIVEGQVSRLLHGPVPLFLGRISFSLYLTHVIVLVWLVRVLDHRLALSVRVLLAVPTALAVAYLFNTFVERPAGKLGSHVASRFRRSTRRTELATSKA